MVIRMTTDDLKKICEEYPNFEIEFKFTDGYSKFPNIRDFKNIEIADIGHSDKVIILTGDEHDNG